MKRIALLTIISCLSLLSRAQQYTRLTNLPHVYIETFNHVSITSKTEYVYSTMHYVDEQDVVTTYDSMEIRGRGNSTWNLPKKPYRIKFHEKEKFLGKGYANAKKWTLLANAGDKTLMRNSVTLAMGEWLGMKNTPACRFVDLTLNGTYVGTYQISDQVEVRPHRVNITEQDYPLADTSDITGGYLLEVDGFYDGNCFVTSRNAVPVRVHYPDEDEIDASQNEYIRSYINNFEKVLNSSDFADADKGYRRWVDSVSLANWFIATEVSGNIDGYYSTYFYKEQQDSLLYWGPLWDYDIAYANDSRKGDTSERLMTDVGYGQTKEWINRMWSDPWFAKLINRRYAEVVEGGLENFLYHHIDSISALLDESKDLNYNKWGISTRVLRERVLYSSYDRYVDDLKSYIHKHIPYLQETFEGKKPAEPTPPFVPADYYYTICHSTNGKVIDVKGHEAVDGTEICLWTVEDNCYGQHWQIIPVEDYFMIVNRTTGMALCDPTEGASTATTNTGTCLAVTEPDIEDDSQLWTIMPQGTNGLYNLINKRTDHTANLSGGKTADGSDIVSYTTDSRNSSSSNRLWRLEETDAIECEPETPDTPEVPDGPETPETPDTPDTPDIPETPETPDTPETPETSDTPDIPDAIASASLLEYALGYDPMTKILHFGSETPELLTFRVHVYSSSGKCVRTFRASDQCSMADLPKGVYIIVWREEGKSCSVKLAL